MTPKEKADELYGKFHFALPSYADEGQQEHQSAKQCALIAVNELIENHNRMKDFLFSEIGYLITSPEYWQEVKTEIEKL